MNGRGKLNGAFEEILFSHLSETSFHPSHLIAQFGTIESNLENPKNPARK